MIKQLSLDYLDALSREELEAYLTSSASAIEITRDGKAVARLIPYQDAKGLSKSLKELAVRYSAGEISWAQIADITGASYGELLVELGLQNLKIPKCLSKKNRNQINLFHRILDSAAQAKSRL